MDSLQAERERQRTDAWSPGQSTLNDAGARVPDHRLFPPVPVVARVDWADDGVEHVDTVALGWSGHLVRVRLTDPRWRVTALWVDGSDVRRR
jgi:hypothetical protein